MIDELRPSWADIAEYLYFNGPTAALILAEDLDRSQTAVTRDLSEMLKAGYVERVRRGRFYIYSLTKEMMRANSHLGPSWIYDGDDEDDGFWIPTDALAVMCDTARHMEAVVIAQWLLNTANELEDRGSADDEREAIILRRKAQEIQERAPFVRGISNGKLN